MLLIFLCICKALGIVTESLKSLKITLIENIPLNFHTLMNMKNPMWKIMRTLITINGVQIAFYNTHLSYEEVKLDNGISLREAQFDYILQLLKSDPCPYKIVTGDYNLLGFYEFSKLLDNGYSIVNNQNKIYDSYRGDDCNFKAIDNIIYSDNLELISSGMKEDDCSDHNMLYAKFKTIK